MNKVSPSAHSVHSRLGSPLPPNQARPLILAVELGKNKGLAIGKGRRIPLNGKLSAGVLVPYLGQGTVLPCIPLLAVQADLDALAQKQHGPHQHVPRWPCVLVMHHEVHWS